MREAISLENVNVHLGGEWILRNLSFDVYLGEFMGIIGPNGAGKTTLLRVLLGMIQPQDGRVQVMGKDITTVGSSLIGYIPQSRQTPLQARTLLVLGYLIHTDLGLRSKIA